MKKKLPAKDLKIESEQLSKTGDEKLFESIVGILEEARSNVVRAVNSNMVIAYWLIGREIVEEEQRVKNRAGYGEALLIELSKHLVAD